MKSGDALQRHRSESAGRTLAAAVVLAIGAVSAAGPVTVSCETSKLFPPNPSLNTYFGNALAHDGMRLIVGHDLDNELGVFTGAAHIYLVGVDRGDWSHEAVLHASDASPAARFGRRVAIAGELAIVASLGYQPNGAFAGAAYIFRRDAESGKWAEEAKLLPAQPMIGDSYASSIAIHDDLAFVGKPLDEQNGEAAGAMYAYQYDPDARQWIEIAKLFPSDPHVYQRFGTSVVIGPDVAAIGAPGDDSLGTSAGAVYLFEFDRQDSQWVEQEKLSASDTDVVDNFGGAMAMRGNELIVGSPNAQTGVVATNGEGAAYVFRRLGNRWVEQAKLIASDGELLDEFGTVLDIENGLAVVGVNANRSIYTYHVGDGGRTVVEDARLRGSDDDPDDGFGRSVAAVGELVLGGVTGDDEQVHNGGAVYFFEGYDEDLNGNGVPDICESPPNDQCVGAPLIPTGTTAFTNIVARTDGPPEPGCGDFQRDVWFKFVVPCAGLVTIDLCGSEFESEAAVYTSCPESGGTVVACSAAGCAEPISFQSTPAVYRIRVGGVDGDRGNGSITIACTTIPGDLNADAHVDVLDLLALLAAWGPCPAPPGACPADLDGDGVVNMEDLKTLLANWG